MNMYMPVKLYTGSNCVIEHSSEFSSLGKSCLILTGKHGAKACGALDDVISALERHGVSFMVFDGVTENPTVALCAQAGSLASENNLDFIVGIGGGSAMDAAKACSVFASNPEMTEAEFYSAVWPVDPKPVILVGTTSGTGSEVTNVSVLVDSKPRKHSIHDNRMYARTSFGDPAYTISLSQKTTLSTGIDVLAHCTESYFTKKASEISRAYSVRGIRLLYEPLLKACSGEPLSLDDRNRLYEASILGGLAISGTGTAFPHTVGYYFTETYSLPHGIASSLFFPELLKHAQSADTSAYNSFLDETGLSEESLVNLASACCGERVVIAITREEIDSIRYRWVSNGSVNNTIGHLSADDISNFFIEKYIN